MHHYCDNRNHKQMERELVKSDWPASRTYALPTPEHVTGHLGLLIPRQLLTVSAHQNFKQGLNTSTFNHLIQPR